MLVATSWACENDHAPELAPTPRYIASFGTWGNDEGEFQWPWAIAVGPDSLLYVTDTDNERVVVFTAHGQFVKQLPIGGSASIIVVAPDTSIYVHFYNGSGFVRYTGQGKIMNALNFVNVVSGLEIDVSGNVYICGLRVYGPDPLHPYIEGPYFWKFNSQQVLIKKWGYPGPTDTTGWNGGRMTWNTKGNLVVMGQIDSTTALLEFTPDGDPVSAWRIPTLPSAHLDDIACDRSDRILITSPPKNLVYLLDSQGTLLSEFSELNPEEEEPLSDPVGIAVDTNGFIYVVDFARHRVVKYQQAP